MSITKVLVNETSQIDLSDKTAEISSVKSGITAHTSSGNQIVGDGEVGDVEKVWCNTTSTNVINIKNGTNNNGTLTFNPTALNWNYKAVESGLTFQWREVKNLRARFSCDYVITGLVSGGSLGIAIASYTGSGITADTGRIRYDSFPGIGSGQTGDMSGHYESNPKTITLPWKDASSSGSYDDSYYIGWQIYAYTGAGSHVEVSNIKFEIEMPSVEDAIITRHISGEYENDEITKLRFSAFRNANLVTSVNFPNVSSCGNYAFENCLNLSSVSMSLWDSTTTAIPNYMFTSCAISQASYSNVTIINTNAFQSCTKLSYISFPNATTIGSSAFMDCGSLTQAIFPECTQMYNSAFFRCTHLSMVSFPKALCTVTTGNATFQQCSVLTSVYFPLAQNTQLGLGFTSCTSLSSVAFPRVAQCPKFTGCTNLSIADVYLNNAANTAGTGQQTIQNTAFQNCTKLSTVIIRYPLKYANMQSTTAFAGTPYVSTGTGGVVYVPRRLISQYQTATNWATYYGYGTMTFSAIEGSQYENTYGDGTSCVWWDYEWKPSDGVLEDNGWTKTTSGTASETITSDGLVLSADTGTSNKISFSNYSLAYKSILMEIVVRFTSVPESGYCLELQVGTDKNTSHKGGLRLSVNNATWTGNGTASTEVETGVDYNVVIGIAGNMDGGNPTTYAFVDDVKLNTGGRNATYQTVLIQQMNGGSAIIKSIKVKNLLW